MAANPVVSVGSLRIVGKGRDSQTTIHAAGRITSATAAALEHTLHELIPNFKRIVLDLSAVDYIDSSGFAALVTIYTEARMMECDLEIANSRPRLKDRLRTWAHKVFAGHEDFLGLTPD